MVVFRGTTFACFQPVSGRQAFPHRYPVKIIPAHGAAFLLLVLPSIAKAQILAKAAQYTQSGAGVVALNTSSGIVSPYLFTASIAGTSSSPSAPNSITLPNSSGSQSLIYNGSRWDLTAGFASQAALTAAFPNGTYIFTFGGRNDSVPFTGDLFPNPLVAATSAGTWSSGYLVVDSAQLLTLTTQFTQNFLAGQSGLAIDVTGAPLPLHADNSPSLAQSQVSLTVPANTFPPGAGYVVSLAGQSNCCL